MQEPKSGVGRRELNALFTKIATLIEENGGAGDDFIDIAVEPIVEAFIERHYSDVEPDHITLYLWMWFSQWRTSSGLWSPSTRS